MELQQVFVEDRPGMLIYVKEYMRRYKGRAFPVKFDFAIFAKALSSAKAKGGLSDDQKEDIKKIKGLQAKLDSTTSKHDALRNEVNALKTKVAGIKTSGTGSGSGNKPTCHFCGEEGHMSFNCKLNPESSKFDPKFKAKKAPKKADEATDDDE
jgi:outer membrane murein-binding lipoprotein Lpp